MRKLLTIILSFSILTIKSQNFGAKKIAGIGIDTTYTSYNGARPTLFTIGNEIYIGPGYVTSAYDSYKDCRSIYKLNTLTNKWFYVDSFPDTSNTHKRYNKVNFVINNKVYISAFFNTGTEQLKTWMFDPATKTWAVKAGCPS
jgi:hypothetical protein